MSEPMTDAEVHNQITTEVAEFMGYMLQNYAKYPKHVISDLIGNLGAYVAITSKSPQEALKSVAERILLTDYASIRAEHFGYTLGCHETQQKPLKLASLGDPT